MKNKKPIIISLIIWLISTIISILLEDTVKEYASKISGSHIFINYVIPIIILLLPLAALIFSFYYYYRKEKNQESKEKDENIKVSISDILNSDNSSSLNPKLKELGIINVTNGLKSSKYAPLECMKTAKKHLFFLGVLGSKWVAENEFEKFLKKIDVNHGSVKFLLINPDGKAYNKLYQLREGTINTSSLEKFRELASKYDCIRIKLYDELPSFRMIFLDNNILALSRYKLDKKGYFESKYGWENPHLIIEANYEWSLYGSFEELYYQIWNKSTDIEDYFNQKEK